MVAGYRSIHFKSRQQQETWPLGREFRPGDHRRRVRRRRRRFVGSRTGAHHPNTISTQFRVAAGGHEPLIDDLLADVLHFRWHEAAQGRVYDLHFTYRSKAVATLRDLPVQAVQNAVCHANAWSIATSPSEAGLLKDSTLAGAYGLSPKEVRRRSRLAPGQARHRGHTSPPPEHTSVDGPESRRMAILRGNVEDAAHQLLIESVANPTTRTQVLIAICSSLDAHAPAGCLAIRNPDVLWQAPEYRPGR